MILNKLEITQIPFEKFSTLNVEDLEDLCKQTPFHNYEQWLLPQAAAHYGRWQVATAEGRIDIRKTLRDNIGNNAWELGLYRVMNIASRGLLVKSQSSEEGSTYSRLVPMIMMGLKKFQGIQYESWRHEDVKLIVGDKLAEAMLSEYEDFTQEELLEARDLGLTIKTGVKAGQRKKITSTWSLTGVKRLRVGQLPTLAQTMLCQIWVAHPTLRNEFMILDPKSWDTMPAPIIDSEVLDFAPKKQTTIIQPTIKTVVTDDNKLPWEL
jgi:hypothetical protein